MCTFMCIKNRIMTDRRLTMLIPIARLNFSRDTKPYPHKAVEMLFFYKDNTSLIIVRWRVVGVGVVVVVNQWLMHDQQ